MTNVMYDVYYDKRKFNFDYKELRHPNYITEKHFIYHLLEDERGYLICQRASNGEPVRSPRKLRNICICRLVSDGQILSNFKSLYLPTNVYPMMLTEAIFLREPRAIEWIISAWPMRSLRVYDVLPAEDCIDDDYLTLPFEGNEEVSLIDCFVVGLLKLRPESKLRIVDFTNFEKDRKLCKELCRLPILWMKPELRTVENIHSAMSETLDITKDKVQCFLNRISSVYSNIESEFMHGNKIDTVTVILDLHITIDDVPIGLSLQHLTPFRFSCSRLWMKPVQDVRLSPGSIARLLDINCITSFEYEDPSLSFDGRKMNSLFEALATMKNLSILSLPDCINCTVNPMIGLWLNNVLRNLKQLRRLNLSYCNIKNSVGVILGGMRQKLNYLNLKDCRLSEDDMFFLVNWPPLALLRELNLSCNDLQYLDQVVILMLERMPLITCFSVSYCSLSIGSQILITQECRECSRLKVLCIQGYTPPQQHDVLELLAVCSEISTLQKAVLFPEAYAFPGNIERDRELNKYYMMRTSYRFLDLQGRLDIELE